MYRSSSGHSIFANSMSWNWIFLISLIITNLFHITETLSTSSTLNTVNAKDALKVDRKLKLIFPGGGIFFYWQAGAVSYLREAGYNLDDVSFSGASAGALVATLTATDVDFEEATELALSLCETYGVWERPLGLFGIWGGIIEEWLDELVPLDAVDQIDGRLSILLTPVPNLGKARISSFKNKEDLIACNMASIHLPFFLDKKPVTQFRESAYIDGSFWSKTEDYCDSNQFTKLVLDWQQDPIMAANSGDFVKALGREGIWSIFRQGQKFASELDAEGGFKVLKRR